MQHRTKHPGSCGVLALVLVLALWAGPAPAQTSNYWNNTSGGNYTNNPNWNTVPSGNTAPATTTDWAFFTNVNGSATVQFTTSVTNGPLRVASPIEWDQGGANGKENVVFDLNGYNWRSVAGGPASDNITLFGGSSDTGSVTFMTSTLVPSVPGGNVVNLDGTAGGYLILGGEYANNPVVNVFTGTTVNAQGAAGWNQVAGKLNVVGTGAKFLWTSPGAGLYLRADVTIANGGYVYENSAGVTSIGGFIYNSGYARDTLWTIGSNSVLETRAAGYVGVGGPDKAVTMEFQPGSTWLADQIQLGGDWRNFLSGTTARYLADVAMTNATLIGSAGMIIGNTMVDFVGGANAGAFDLNARLTISGSTMTLSNGYLMINAGSYTTGGVSYSNTLVFANSTIKLGKPGSSGVLTNRGILKAMGTITGMGTTPALVRNEAFFEVGGSPGTLTLNNANLELAAGSQTLFEFGDTDLSQIVINGGGTASLLGSNLFSLATGASLPAAGLKYGLGTYDFVIATNITWNPQFDGLSNLLSGYGLTFGQDYHYGLVNLGNGLQALELTFVPEPSTVMLLLGGGLLLWRARRRRS